MKDNQIEKVNKVPFEHKKTAYWVASDVCNYRCDYCFTLSKKPTITNPLFIAQTINKKLKGNWEIILSGGEPFVLENFNEIVDQLVGNGHYISVYTNFSAPEEQIIGFLKITSKLLAKFIASLHLQYLKVDDFLYKITSIEKKCPDFKKHLMVHIAATKNNLLELKNIKQRFFNAGIQLIVFPLLNKELEFFDYTTEQEEILKNIINSYNLNDFADFSVACGNYGLNKESVIHRGRNCGAGHNSIFIIPTGGVYSCLQANRKKTEFLGNILSDEFHLNNEDLVCPFELCTFPASYRQYYWCLADNN